MNGTKPYGPSGNRRMPKRKLSRGVARVSFPLTPALSRGERVNHSLLGAQSRGVALPLREARFSLSQRERVRVRGNGAKFHPAYRTNQGTFALSESSGKTGGFPR